MLKIMKIASKIILAVLVGTTALSSCEVEYDKTELYRKEIYLVSGENNIFGQEYTFEGGVGHLPVYVSGTTMIDRDVTVAITKDYEALAEYNKRNFDQDFDSYALELPEDRYAIEEMTVTLKAGEKNPYALLDIEVNTDGLTGDVDYFIPLRIESVSDYMASTTKNYVLYKIQMKNDYATTRVATNYMMYGAMQPGTKDSWGAFAPTGVPVSINATKSVVPLDWTSVVTMPGARVAATDDGGRQRRNQSIVVTVDPFQTIDIPVLDRDGQPTDEFVTMLLATVRPYGDSAESIQVETVPDDPCYYDPASEAFYLSYRFLISGESEWYWVQEAMYDTRY